MCDMVYIILKFFKATQSTDWLGDGGYLHVKAYGNVPPKWVNFSPKILQHGSILVKTIIRRASLFTTIEKNVKSAISEVEKHFKMGLDLQKFQQQKTNKQTTKNSHISCVLSEKNP